jgi:hypothetical protein
MKRFLTALVMLLAFTGPALAQFYPGGQPKWGPDGNGTLEHEDDLRWIFFHDAKITADEAKGVYTAIFPPLLKKEDGVRFSITGYMMPVEASSTSAHFVLTRRSAGCPFCPPNEPTEAIEIFATRPIDYTPSPITVEGTLHLVSQSAQGLFFRIDKATIN